MEGSRLYSHLIARINLHVNYSISQNVKQSKVVGELFIETRGTWKPHSLWNFEASSDCIKCRLTIVKQRCALFCNPHTSQIDTCRSNYRPGNYCARLLICPTLWYRILDGGTDWNLASSNEASDCIYIGTLPRRLLETIDQQEVKLQPMAYRTKTSLCLRGCSSPPEGKTVPVFQ
jgi:hypothetical protein